MISFVNIDGEEIAESISEPQVQTHIVHQQSHPYKVTGAYPTYMTNPFSLETPSRRHLRVTFIHCRIIFDGVECKTMPA